MCGRFILTVPERDLIDHFDVGGFPDLRPRYNIAPTQQVPVVLATGDGRMVSLLRWGLVPSWASDVKIGSTLINARADTVAVKPSYRSAFKSRRCLVPASGFYEWQPTGGKKKQPWLFSLTDQGPFALAGLWERWHKGGEPVETFTLITTEANAVVSPVHDRMPVILPMSAYDVWLDPKVKEADVLLPLLKPFDPSKMTAVQVGLTVNSPRYDGPECVAPLSLV